MNIPARLVEELQLKESSVVAAIALLDEGNTVPFIARYRKEVTGNLTDNDLRRLEERLNYLRNLQARMDTVISSIEEQGKLTDELKEKIENAKTLAEVEDLYRPYKQKKKTRAVIAKERGLEPLAKTILKGRKERDFDTYLSTFVNPEKGVKDEEAALQGASDIIAEEISDNADYRSFIKGFIARNGSILYFFQYIFTAITRPNELAYVQMNSSYTLYANIPARIFFREVVMIALFGIISPLLASWAASKNVLKMTVAEVLHNE